MRPPRDHSRSTRTDRSAFTLIELLVVVVIVGLLAAIAVPRFEQAKGKANFAALESDLHNVMTAEEGFYYQYQRYTTALDSLDFSPSPGDQLTIAEATVAGWSASATNPASYPHLCALFMGTATPVDPATTSGQTVCR